MHEAQQLAPIIARKLQKQTNKHMRVRTYKKKSLQLGITADNEYNEMNGFDVGVTSSECHC